MKPIIGVNNPYGLILKGGKKKRVTRRKKVFHKKTRKYYK